MTTHGSQQWQWEYSGRRRIRRKRFALPLFEAGTARSSMGMRRPPFVHTTDRDARKRRENRLAQAESLRVIASQLALAKKRKPCSNKREIRPTNAKAASKVLLKQGEEILFAPSGPQLIFYALQTGRNSTLHWIAREFEDKVADWT